MANKSTIELPRLEGESAKAHLARIEYVTMGAGRSFDRLLNRYQSATKAPPTKRRDTIVDWSVRYGWQDSAREYDDQIAFLTIQEAADQYRADLADYRKRYGDMGKALYGSAAKLLRKVNATLDLSEMAGLGSLITVINAVKTAADLEALALRIEPLLGQLQTDDD